MKDENYIIIQGWMINRLQLKGNELLTYAIIYGFSQDEESTFHGSLSFMENMLNVSRKTVIETIKSLLEKGLIERVKTSHYRTINIGSVKTPLVEKLHQTSVETILAASVETTPFASVETTPNNNNTKYNTNNNINIGKNFISPSLDEIKNYVNEEKIEFDCEKFFYFYESNGWKIGKNKMKNWKMTIKSWNSRNQKNYKTQELIII